MNKDLIYNDADINKINNSDFITMLKFYNQFEKKAAYLLSKILNNNNYIFNNDYKYDILFTDINLSFEIKNDNMMTRTGNIAIEYNYNNKPSGILTSEANYYIINDRINYYMIETIILKQLIDINKFVYVKNNNTYCYLLDNNLILDNSINLIKLLKYLEDNNIENNKSFSYPFFKNDYINDVNYNYNNNKFAI